MKIFSMMTSSRSILFLPYKRIKSLNSLGRMAGCRELSTDVSDKSEKQKDFAVTIGKSTAWMLGGLAIAHGLPYGTPTAASIFVLSYFASRASQPFVNTKLAVQRAAALN